MNRDGVEREVRRVEALKRQRDLERHPSWTGSVDTEDPFIGFGADLATGLFWIFLVGSILLTIAGVLR